VPNLLPAPHLPAMNFALMRQVFPSAVTIALLAAIESLLSAVVADGMTGTRHRSNMEVMAQGFANIGVVFFGGIPATGAIARTATNIRNGAVSPVAGVVHAVTLLGIMVFFAKYAVMVPMCVLAAILMKVALNMAEVTLFIRIFRCSPRGDVFVLLVSFLLTVLVDITVAIQTGVVLAALLFMHRMAALTQSRYITSALSDESEDDDSTGMRKRDMPPGVEVFEIYGPFFFGVADTFKTAVHSIDKNPDVFILRMRHVLSMDLTALRALEDLFEKTVHDGTTLVLSGIHTQPLSVLKKSGLYERIGENNITGHIDDALNRARELLILRCSQKA
jgi:sulfate permease, SulP family